MTFLKPILPPLGALLTLAGLSLSGCSDGAAPANPPASAPLAAGSAASAAGPQASGGPANPPISVTTVKAQKRDMAVRLQASGTVTSLSAVDVKPQMTAAVRQVHFKEGQFVKAGQLLFTLDARTEEANLAKARAQLLKDQASLADAQRQWERARQLFDQRFISQGAVDTARTQVESWQATVQADRAAVQASEVAVSYSRVSAPQSGRTGAVKVFAGTVVLANQTTLVGITQMDPIGVSFSLPQRDLGSALRALQQGAAPVTATLADGGGAFQGRLQFMDSAVDAGSGAVQLKAVFDNPQNALWPGAFVQVSQTISTLEGAVVVPQVSVIQGPRGAVVYVVADGVATPRPVQVQFAQDGAAAVKGVKPGESVVLEGRQNLRPNARVIERAPQPAGAGPGAGSGGGGGGKRQQPGGADGVAAEPAALRAAASGADSAGRP